MKLLPNQLVKILFRNGTSIEGIVEVWDEDYVLRSEDGKSILIIQDPSQDIMAIKVILREQDLKRIEPKQNYAADDPDSSIPNPQELRAKKLAELHLLAAAQEKQDVINKLRNHNIGEIKQVKYSPPSFLKGNK